MLTGAPASAAASERCDSLEAAGCVGWVYAAEGSVCYMRKLAAGESWLTAAIPMDNP